MTVYSFLLAVVSQIPVIRVSVTSQSTAAYVTELLLLADAVLLVVRTQRTPRELSKRALEMLGGRLHGVILNEATIDSNPHYRYVRQYHQKSESNKT